MQDQIKYLQAKKRVKQIKGFYIHAGVFVLVNIFLIIIKFLKQGEIKDDFWGMSLWAAGLMAHGASVFLPSYFLGKNWEEQKIREFMEKDKHFNP